MNMDFIWSGCIIASSLEDAIVEAVVQELRTEELLVNPSGFSSDESNDRLANRLTGDNRSRLVVP